MPRLDCVVTMALMPSGNTNVFCNTTGSGAWTEIRDNKETTKRQQLTTKIQQLTTIDNRQHKETTTKQQQNNKQTTNRQQTDNKETTKRQQTDQEKQRGKKSSEQGFKIALGHTFNGE